MRELNNRCALRNPAMTPRRLLFVDDEENVLKSLKRLFLNDEYEILTALNGEQALDILCGKKIPLVISDHTMPGMQGVDLLKRIKEISPHTIGILLTGITDRQTAVSAINSGAVYRYIAKPWNDGEVKIIVREALEKYDVEEENRKLTKAVKEQNKLLRELNLNLQRAKELLTISFQRYMSEHLVREILESSQPVSLSGQKRDVTVLISDIRGFTSLAENMATEKLVVFLNQYFKAMVDVVLDNSGLLDKFMGDALMALFGAVCKHDDDPLRAVRTAVEMQEVVKELNKTWSMNGGPRIKIGIGISTGEVIVGNIGSEQRMEFTGIGPDVNYAQRIESLSKIIPSPILISESTYLKVKNEVCATRYGPVQIKGKKEPATLYGVESMKKKRRRKGQSDCGGKADGRSVPMSTAP